MNVFTNLSTKINQAEVCYTSIYVERKNIISVQVFMRHEAGSAQRQALMIGLLLLTSASDLESWELDTVFGSSIKR